MKFIQTILDFLNSFSPTNFLDVVKLVVLILFAIGLTIITGGLIFSMIPQF